MALIFWLSFILVAYTYFGYALLLAIYSRVRRCPLKAAKIRPSVSVVMPVHNEQELLPAKLSNLSALSYPVGKLQIVVASDGSSDRSAEILLANASNLTPVILQESHGKAGAINEAVRHAQGEILVFFDVRQTVDRNAIEQLIACFSDPDVGAVSGELMLESTSGQAGAEGLGIYWKIEKVLRKLESQTGSVVGVTGAIYAVRRELFVEMPKGTLLDDVLVPMNVARLGKRVVFQPLAIARDRIFAESGKEFSRKVRTLTGNYQLLRLAPWLLSAQNPLRFRFVSHKLLRLLVPFFLALMLITSALAGGTLLHLLCVLQLVFYGLAVVGALISPEKRIKPIAIAYTFVLLNTAAVFALRNFVLGRDKVWH